jgi:polysaccharide biosynthesis protein PslG
VAAFWIAVIALFAWRVDWGELSDVTGSSSAEAPAPAPPRAAAPERPDQLVGVQLHPFFDEQTPESVNRELDLARDTGANSVRVDLNWSSLQINGPEPDPDFVARVDQLVDGARQRGLRVVVTMLSTPCWASRAPESLKQGCRGPWWERGVTEYGPSDPTRFADAAAFVASRWGEDLAALEIWNEPNYELFLRSEDPAREYGRILRAAYPLIKRERPELPVLAGSFALADVKFLRQLYDEGRILGSYDAIAWHPYSHPYSPMARKGRAGVESSFRDGAAALREVMRTNGDERAELWATEAGATTCRKGVDERCVDAETQARWIREYVDLSRDMPWLRSLFIYNLRDKGTDPEDVEAGFGLVRQDFSPKPAFESFRGALAQR